MGCMKCAKEIPEKQAFCSDCLAVMSRKPVKAGTAVLLPARPAAAAVKKAAPKKRQPTAEEQLRKMKNAVKWLSIALTCLVLALALTISFLVQNTQAHKEKEEIGKNYNTVGYAQQP